MKDPRDRCEKLALSVHGNKLYPHQAVELLESFAREIRNEALRDIAKIVRDCGTNQPCQQCIKIMNGMIRETDAPAANKNSERIDMKFRKKPVEVEAITFAEFVEYGKANTTNVVNGMPWSFDYKGQPITHETDECYLIPTLEGTMKFTPGDMLITGVKGEIYPCKMDIFEATYDPVTVA